MYIKLNIVLGKTINQAEIIKALIPNVRYNILTIQNSLRET